VELLGECEDGEIRPGRPGLARQDQHIGVGSDRVIRPGPAEPSAASAKVRLVLELASTRPEIGRRIIFGGSDSTLEAHYFGSEYAAWDWWPS